MKFMKLSLMQNLILKKYRFLIVIFYTIFLFSSPISANELIIVKGNKNIPLKTIYSIAPKELNTLNPELINIYQKELYKTGFFENVKISIQDKKILVSLIENPLINFFFIEGTSSDKILTKINDIIKSKENTILQPFLIKEDVKNISNFLKSLGYLDNKINYQLIKINDNKVNLFYKIELKNKFKIKRIFFYR